MPPIPSTSDQFEQLLAQHQPMITKLAQRYSTIHGVSLDILLQAGRLGLLRASQLWRANSRASFATYCSHWVIGKIRREAVRERSIVVLPDKAYRRGERLTMIPLDAPPEHTHADNPSNSLHETLTTPQPPPTDYDLHDALLRAIARLNPKLREAIDLYFFEDLNTAEVGAHLGICKQSAHQRIQRALRKMRRELEHNGERQTR